MTRLTTYAILGFVVAALLGVQYWQYKQALLKMQLLDISLQVAARRDSTSAAGKVKYIAASVAKYNNQSQDLYVLRLSEKIQVKTDSALRLFPVMRKLLSNKTHSSAQSSEANKTAVQLQQHVKAYLQFIQAFDSDSLFGSPSDLGIYKAEIAACPELAGALAGAHDKQALLSGGNASPAAAMAMLTQQEYELRLHELNALEQQAQKVGTRIDSYFEIGAFATAESNSVAAGETYKAQLFLSASASGIKTRMTVNGKPIEVSTNGRGQVKLHVPPSVTTDKPIKAYWDGTIRVAYNGRDSTFHIRVPYTILPAQH